MRHTLSLILGLGLLLPGCARLADSRFNPLNWFGGSTPVASVQADGTPRPLLPEGGGGTVADARATIDQILDVQIERTTSGAILRATGLAATQGFYNAELVLVPVQSGSDTGDITYEFRVAAPAGFEAIGTEASRRITVALTLSAAELAGIRSITVQGLQNGRTTRR